MEPLEPLSRSRSPHMLLRLSCTSRSPRCRARAHLASQALSRMEWIDDREQQPQCEVCSKSYGAESFPFDECRYCGACPSRHHGRCCQSDVTDAAASDEAKTKAKKKHKTKHIESAAKDEAKTNDQADSEECSGEAATKAKEENKTKAADKEESDDSQEEVFAFVAWRSQVTVNSLGLTVKKARKNDLMNDSMKAKAKAAAKAESDDNCDEDDVKDGHAKIVGRWVARIAIPIPRAAPDRCQGSENPGSDPPGPQGRHENHKGDDQFKAEQYTKQINIIYIHIYIYIDVIFY